MPKTKPTALIEVKPTDIYFKGPYGMLDQNVQAKLTNLSDRPIAFKVCTDKTPLYQSNPTKGVVPAGEFQRLELVMLKVATDIELEPRTKKHHFFVHAMQWPKDWKEFDKGVWNEQETVCKVDVQKVTLTIDHDPATTKRDATKNRPDVLEDALGPSLANPPPNQTLNQYANTAKPPVPVQSSPVQHRLEHQVSMQDAFSSRPASLSPPKMAPSECSQYKGPATVIDAPPSMQGTQLTTQRNQGLVSPPTTPISATPPVPATQATARGTARSTVTQTPVSPPHSTTPSSSATPLSRNEFVDADDNRFVALNPTAIAFGRPFGRRQSQTLTVTNATPQYIVAFKIHMNKCEYYRVNPTRAVIPQGQSISVTIELNERFAESTEGADHRMQVTAIRWPAREKVFNQEQWKTLVDRKKSVQLINVPLHFNR